MDYEQHNMVRQGETRWLSLLKSVDRIMEQWEPLEEYFSNKTEDKTG